MTNTLLTATARPLDRCDACGGSGKWVCGPITNGVPAREGVCFRCRGKGLLTAADHRKNRYYDNHIRRV